MKTLFLLMLMSFSLNSYTKTIIISDIDDTIKTSNSMGVLGQIYHFLKMGNYPAMSALYNDFAMEFKSDGFEIIYVSAAPDAIYDQDAWLASRNFPRGESYLRASLLEDTYSYKMRTIRKILQTRDLNADFYFFGDNSSKDRKVYQDIVSEFKIKNFSIYIRDVSTKETFNKAVPTAAFFTELDLISEFPFMSTKTRDLIYHRMYRRTLLPRYTIHTLKNALRKRDECSGGCELAHELLNSYYRQF